MHGDDRPSGAFETRWRRLADFLQDVCDKCLRCCAQFENNYFTEMCSGSDAGSYLRLIDFVYHSTLGVRVIKKKRVCCATCIPQA